MAAIKFKYKRGTGGIYRPIADVVIEASDIKVAVSMYIDSGADISIIPFRFGRALGFLENAREIKEIKGIAGEPVPYIVKKVAMALGGYKFMTRLGWALIEEVPLFLGRLDIFPRFKIIFDESNKSVVFVPKDN